MTSFALNETNGRFGSNFTLVLTRGAHFLEVVISIGILGNVDDGSDEGITLRSRIDTSFFWGVGGYERVIC